jgi:hypothetical protein
MSLIRSLPENRAVEFMGSTGIFLRGIYCGSIGFDAAMGMNHTIEAFRV